MICMTNGVLNSASGRDFAIQRMTFILNIFPAAFMRSEEGCLLMDGGERYHVLRCWPGVQRTCY